MQIDLNNLTAEQKQALREALGLPSENQGRSPEYGNRQLHDLRLLPTSTDPRPTFFFIEAPRDRDVSKTYEFEHGKLMWSSDGTEICVRSRAEQDAKLKQGYSLMPIGSMPVDPDAERKALLASLSPDDRKLVLASHKKAHLGRIEDALADLTPDEVKALSEA
jgi:hypothetical protein